MAWPPIMSPATCLYTPEEEKGSPDCTQAIACPESPETSGYPVRSNRLTGTNHSPTQKSLEDWRGAQDEQGHGIAGNGTI